MMDIVMDTGDGHGRGHGHSNDPEIKIKTGSVQYVNSYWVSWH
jgi:hypothetical protein